MGRRAAAIASILAAFVCGATQAPPRLADLEQALLDRLDEARAELERPSLGPHGALQRAAELEAEAMLDQRFYGHVAPDGSRPLQRARPATRRG